MLISYQFTGGSVTTFIQNHIYLSEVSTTKVTDFSIAITDENNPDTAKYSIVNLEFSTLPEATGEQPRDVNVYLGTSPDVSVLNYDFRLHGPGIIKLNKFPKGLKLYAIAYPDAVFCNPYFDPFQQVYIYSCYGTPTEVVEFIVP